MASWHTELERELIREFGGEPLEQFGPDGTLDGAPVEVRVARKDDRFRLGKSVHEELLAEGGSYIFDDVDDGLPPKRVDAADVDAMLDGGNWFEDRDYPHRFVTTDDIF